MFFGQKSAVILFGAKYNALLALRRRLMIRCTGGVPFVLLKHTNQSCSVSLMGTICIMCFYCYSQPTFQWIIDNRVTPFHVSNNACHMYQHASPAEPRTTSSPQAVRVVPRVLHGGLPVLDRGHALLRRQRLHRSPNAVADIGVGHHRTAHRVPDPGVFVRGPRLRDDDGFSNFVQRGRGGDAAYGVGGSVPGAGGGVRG